MRRRTSPTTILLLLIIVGVAATYLRNARTAGMTDTLVGDQPDCGLSGCEGLAEPQRSRIVFQEADACRDVGYLCADLKTVSSFTVRRWADDTERIRIRIPLPPNEDPTTARALRSAAVRGISKWNRKPFLFTIDTRARSQAPADIVVEWSHQLGGNQLGVTVSRFEIQGDRLTLNISRLALGTRSPNNPLRQLDADQVMLTAAHEMGHALGLPHSDDPRDVMFETNSARALTTRDYRTIEALYSAPNGAEIVKDN